MSVAILWFRHGLRLLDNPALQAALSACEVIIPVYIHRQISKGEWDEGAASRWWLHHSLTALNQSLHTRQSRLILRRGEPLPILRELIEKTRATHLFFNRRHEPSHAEFDQKTELALRSEGCHVQSFNASLLFDPWETMKADATPYRVYAPYWKALQRKGLPDTLIPVPKQLPVVPRHLCSEPLETLGLLPVISWDVGLRENWVPGEDGALSRLETFLEQSLANYAVDRDRPDRTGTSHLSPHLHFGEISPRRVVRMVQERVSAASSFTIGAESYLRQLGWREFAHHLLYHFPHTPAKSFNPRFEQFPWLANYRKELHLWQQGNTGIPIVDAGLRELWHLGWMHNRVRLIVASFLTKNLLIPWQEGARWFWDTLVDADLANNTLGWQWVAGSGADSAPYFRIFNPVTQGEKFDPQGRYVRRWLPELASVPDKFVHQPWNAPRPPSTYPEPLVDLKASRERALAAFSTIKRRR